MASFELEDVASLNNDEAKFLEMTLCVQPSCHIRRIFNKSYMHELYSRQPKDS